MLRAIKDLASCVGASLAVLSHGKIAFNKYMALAIRNGIDVRNPDACVMINIGQERSDIVIISKGHVLSHRATSVSCETFLEDIIFYMARMRQVRIDVPIAKQIWDAVGSAMSELQDAPEPFEVVVPNLITARPRHILVSYKEISYCLDRNLMSISLLVGNLLEMIPSSLINPLLRRGIFITGEGAVLRGIAPRFEETLGLQCRAIVSSKETI